MGELTLGLDLGSNSIGWALVDVAGGKLVAAGVRVFPEGVDRDTSGTEVSKSVQRRDARSARRHIQRRARRRRVLRRALVEAGLLPESALLARDDPRRVADETAAMREADPYELRRRALGERLEPHQIGRALLHLAQRRGFLSNRKADASKRKETSEMLEAISALEAEMRGRKLGEHLAMLREADPHARVRGKHTRREMLEAEFEAIWESQRRFHPELLTEARKYGTAGKVAYPAKPRALGARKLLEQHGIHGLVFFQRPLYWPKSAVGKCELEKREKRCPRADRRAQRFRLLQEVNNLRLLDSTTGEERALSGDERGKLIDLLSHNRDRTFDQIRDALGLLDSVRFNLEAGDRTKLKGMPTDALLAKKGLFGKAWWKKGEGERDAIVEMLACPEVDEGRVRELAAGAWGVDAEAVLRATNGLDDGYASFSLKAIQKLLAHLERGLPLMSHDGTASAMSEAGYLRPDQRERKRQEMLPEPPDVTNPLVRQGLHEVRKVVNAVLRERVYREGHALGAIHIELAREVKGSAEQRARRSAEMRDRERERDAAAERLREMGVKPTGEAITRLLLWEEQKHLCIYSGAAIGVAQLLGGEVDVDHILPYQRSLDDSKMNRVVCFRRENAAKGDRTPREWLEGSDPEKLDGILQRASSLPYPKAARFRQRDITLDDFIARQLVDTAYISRQVADYVRCLGADVVCTKGQHTAALRRHWGLDRVLRADDLDLKNREDHRHHAVDAVAIALTDRSRLQQLARTRGDEELPAPWASFRADVEGAVNGINVSHKVRRKVAGALHQETFYGPTPEAGVFVVRKPVESLSAAEIPRIRDAAIRKLVEDAAAKAGISTGRKKRGSGEAVNGKALRQALADLRMPSGVPVKKVRILVEDKTITTVRHGRHDSAMVKPGRVHHACIFEWTEKGERKRDAVYVSMLEAARRVERGEALVRRKHPERPDARFVVSVCPGDTVLLETDEGERLMVVSTLVSTQKRIHVVSANDARPSAQKQDRGLKPNTFNARKVTVDPIGQIRWAND